MSNSNGWIGVDLDGTLAHYDGFKGVDKIGAPIGPMVDRVKAWLADGVEVRIFTARVGATKDDRDVEQTRKYIEQWCAEYIGVVLPVTNMKDFGMIQLWDDRCVQVHSNTGMLMTEVLLAQILGKIK